MANAARVTMPTDGVETLYGPYDENLKQLEAALAVRLRTSGSDVVIEGQADGVARAERVFGQFAGLLQDGYRFQRGDVKTAAQLVQQNPNVELAEYFLRGNAKAAGRKQIIPKSVAQRHYLDAIDRLADEGQDRLEAGATAEAAGKFRQALALDPYHAAALDGLTLASERLGQREAARRYRNRAERLRRRAGA